MLKKLFISLSLLFFFCQIKADTACDSAYFKCQTYIYSDSSHVLFNRALALAKATGDSNLIFRVYLLQFDNLLAENSSDLFYAVDSLLPGLTHYSNPKYWVIAICDLVYYYAENYQPQRALDLLLKLENQLREQGKLNTYAQSSILEAQGSIYKGLREYEPALSSYNNGLDLLKEDFLPSKDFYLLRFSLNLDLQETYMLKKDYQNILVCDSDLAINLEKAKNEPYFRYETYVHKDLPFYIHAFRLISYCKLRLEKQAQAEHGKLILCTYPDMDSICYQYALGIYYTFTQNDSLALFCLNSIEKSKMDVASQLEFLSAKRDVYSQMNNFKQAYLLERQINTLNDSIAAIIDVRRLDEGMIKNKVQTLLMKISDSNDKIKNLNIELIIFSIAIFLLFIILFLSFRYRRILQSKNKYLYSNLKKYEELKKENRLYLQNSPKIPSIDIANAKFNFELLEEFMKTEQPYLDLALSKDILAQNLHIDEKRLCELIKEGSDLPFFGYINEYRLDFAYCLIESRPDLNIKEIYLNSGFSSKSTFYRLFTSRYGLTPSELKTSILDENADSN